MKKLIILILFILFIFNNNIVIESTLISLNYFYKSIFPILFPTFIISDLLLSSNLIKYINKIPIYKLFKSSIYTNYILFISFICGTPTNAKNLKILYDNKLINKIELNKILDMCIFFNPFFIIKMTNIKILIIIYISNLLTGFILRNKNKSNYNYFVINNIKFDLNESIKNNIDITLNILGTIIVFNILSNIINIHNVYIKIIYTFLLEFSNGLRIINIFNINNNLFYLITLSFGSISILYQIKSILKDAFDIKSYLKSRFITIIISILLLINY